MNFRQYFILTFAGMLCGYGLMAANAGTAINPYGAIVSRNVFGLVPIPVGPPPKSEPDISLPQITPNGIMSIFGKLQVLFKVSEPGKPGNQEESYVMSVGDRQDDIAVQKIDEQAATITFNNHGTIQELSLVDGKASSGALPPTSNHGMAGRIPLPRSGIPLPRRGGHSPTVAGGGLSVGQQGERAASVSKASSTNPQQKITPEEQVLMIEAQRLKYMEEGNSEMANILPPTELTDQTVGSGANNSQQTPAGP